MPEPDQSKQSFSSGRRWVFRLNFLLGLVALLALLVMVNYLAGGYYKRFQVDALGATRLSPATLRILNLVTNKVDVTIFFDPRGEGEEDLYGMTSALLTEYKNANPQYISVRTLDYTRFDNEAKQLLGRLNMLGLQKVTDFVLFECNGHSKICYAKHLADWDINAAILKKEMRRSGFRGELLFTSAIFSVINPQTLKAYFLTGHGEHDPNDSSDEEGYSKLAGILKEEMNTDWQPLSLKGTNAVPPDCQLLIVGGPRLARFLPIESERIDSYLNHGGRMLLMLDSHFTNSGAETILSQWGIEALNDTVIEKDKARAYQGDGSGFEASGLGHHPVMDAIFAEKMSIAFNSPRPFRLKEKAAAPGEAKLSVLASSSPKSILSKQPSAPASFNLMVAVEQGIKEIGGTRILAIGDSSMVADRQIDTAANHTFAGLALNWLLQRPEILLDTIPARPIVDYKLMVTDSQLGSIELLFLGGLPGLAFLVGGMVWLRRRR